MITVVGLAIVGCTNGRANGRDSVVQTGASITHQSWDSSHWRAPVIAELPNDSLGAAIRRGFALLAATQDSLREYDGSNLNCTSCHLDEGRRSTASPLAGVYARYPRYIDRAGAVVPIEDRINYCMTRSLSGSRLPNDSRAMQDMVAYLAFVSRGVPIGAMVGPPSMPPMPLGTGDATRGAILYGSTCARCHGADGAGMAKVPALWGARSFSVGAGMARQERAASFIRYNMPFDKPGTLSDRDAYDVAAYIMSKPRPDLPGKEQDWPLGNAPRDVPYDTKGHAAYRPAPLLPRRDPESARVPAPRPLTRPAMHEASPARR
jgi:thiosulfate dehydrogenase